ncbi:MAG: leucine--tRNA ligase [Chloroflexi bacterium]|nr:leucine--tRNA ligase [Chloroflexota bacterium]
MTIAYNPQELEPRWQARWEADGLYRVRDDGDKPPWYALTMFPYTSGDLHIGHWFALAPADTHARYMRMKGHSVLHPMGFDAFGLPAENAAIKQGIHPHTWTMDNVARMRRQLRSLGASYDWSREVITCLPEYYKWTQWFFLQFYKHGLAYRAQAPANWCPQCQTVLANEQVVEGRCERCGAAVARRDLEQWFFRITKYADALLEMDSLQWPERIKLMQRNWIGRSAGVEIAFPLSAPGAAEKEVRVFTTRADTTYGVTFLVLAPEHPLVAQLTVPERRREVEDYIAASRQQSEIQRLSTEKEKSGVFIGAYCANPFTGQRVPLFIADYVLMSYGTGAVMAVPAHDTRDFAFAQKYSLPIPVVIAPPGWSGQELKEAYTEEGTMVNSGPFNGLPSGEATERMADWLEERGLGQRTVSYRIRDWLVSRQRYWGAPIPIVYCPQCGTVPVPESELPVLLPQDAPFRPTGESPLKYVPAFVHTPCPRCGAAAQRETDTMDTFMCSNWYYLRYLSSQYDKGPFDPQAARRWMPVAQYTGGAEHAVMHLLYARFFTKAIHDMGLVDFSEPFLRLFNQGIILGEDHEKMSKSRGNVVNPDDYVARLGADTVRAYLMFVGPWEQGGSWSATGIQGITRWLNRVWSLALAAPWPTPPGHSPAEDELRRLLHQTIKRVEQDLERFRFNTMLAALMELSNHLAEVREARSVPWAAWREAIKTLLLLLAPTVPHLAEELWERTGQPYSIHQQAFPVWEAALAQDEMVTLVVQVNGKVRDRLQVPASITAAEAQELALGRDKVKPYLGGQAPQVIYVPKRLVNLVVK